MNKKLYHISSTPDLKILEPRVSSHGKAYVYATDNLEMALLFGSSKSYGDFDGTYGVCGEDRRKPYFYEAYPNAFKRRFEGESCYIYEVDPADFKEGLTSFSAEVVSEKPVKVLKCTKVEDLYAYLLNLIKENKINFKEYSQERQYQEMINNHMRDRFQYIKNRVEHPAYQVLVKYYPHIIEEYKKQNILS